MPYMPVYLLDCWTNEMLLRNENIDYSGKSFGSTYSKLQV